MHFTIFFLLLLSVLAMPSGHFVLVVTRPDAQSDYIINVIGNAGGAFVAPGRLPWIAVAYSDEDHFSERLRKAGALLVLNHALAVGCQQKES